MPVDPFADARAWYDRAQHHIAEYRSSAYSQDKPVWAIHSKTRDDSQIAYSLRMNREVLVRLKPVACEAASAIFQTLDNIVAVAARDAGLTRKESRTISWPWELAGNPDPNIPGSAKTDVAKKIREIAKKGIDAAWLDMIDAVFLDHEAGLFHIDVVKEVSISGKHWGLVPTKGGTNGVGWTLPGEQKPTFIDLREELFETGDDFEFLVSPAQISNFTLVTKTALAAADKLFEPEPIAAFEYASRFAFTALERADSVWKQLHPEQAS